MPQIKIPNTKLSLVPLSSIDEGKRFREDYGDLTDLKFSIQTYGLINPIAVMAKDDNTYTLVAGGRRLRALTELGVSEIPVRIFEEFNELTLRLLELAENLQRKDMTWQEQNRLQREIHQLQQSIYGEASTHSSNGWRLEDTAQMLGVSKSSISDSVRLGEKLERYKDIIGDVGKFKTENDARKAVKIVEESMIRAELAKRAEKKRGTNTFIQMMADSYIIGDCVEGLKASQAEIFDFAEVDPPYGIDLADVKRGNDCEGYTEVNQEEYLIFTKRVMKEVFRTLKPNTFCVWWFGMEPWLEYIFQNAKEIGFSGSRIPLIWTKPNGQSMNPNYSLAMAYETAFVLRKGSPLLAKPGRMNIFDFKPIPPQEKKHPTQKPLELYKEIYSTFSFENAKCVVPFAGSGASLIAASTIGRKALGWDLSDSYKGGYLEMVSSLFLQG